MRLQPRHPPGHGKRKLLNFVNEIQRLRAEGYSIRAIHEALLDAGVDVAWAAVQREVARLAKPPTTLQQQQEPAETVPPARASRTPQVDPSEPIPQTVKVMSDVDEFFERHNSNPLFRKKGLS